MPSGWGDERHGAGAGSGLGDRAPTPFPTAASSIRDQSPEEATGQGLGPEPSLVGFSLSPDSSLPRSQPPLSGSRKWGHSLALCREGLGTPLRRCQRHCHPAVGAGAGISLADSLTPAWLCLSPGRSCL